MHVCVREVHEDVVVIKRCVIERVIREQTHDRLDMAILAAVRRQTRIDGIPLTGLHDHPHHRMPCDDLGFDPPQIGIGLRHRLVLVVPAIGSQLQSPQCIVDVGGEYLRIVPASGRRVLANLSLRDPRTLRQRGPLD